MPRVLVTGANRGLGLEFARQYRDAGWEVMATCRSPEQAKYLNELGVEVVSLDVSNMADISNLPQTMNGRSLDLLLNNAGVYGGAKAGQSLGDVDVEDWLHVLQVNTIAPLKIVEALQGNLEAAGGAKVALVTSKMGSMADNGSGGTYLYRSSKAALNAVGKSLGIDLARHGTATVLLHPGWVRTDMGGPGGLIDAAQSVSGMRDVIAKLTLENSGSFFAFDGQEVPW